VYAGSERTYNCPTRPAPSSLSPWPSANYQLRSGFRRSRRFHEITLPFDRSSPEESGLNSVICFGIVGIFGLVFLGLFFDNSRHWCHIIHVTLFALNLKSGESIFDQLLFAIKRSFISGELRPGQAFPSVRTLAVEFKIHPNTAHKVIQHLIQERWLEVRPGIGTIVAEIPEPRPGDRKRLLQREVEQLVVEAKRMDIDIREVVRAIEERWAKLEKAEEVNRR
jgi:GntR family transcriptional regulator